MPGSDTAGWKHPALAPGTTTYSKKLDDATAHRNKSSPSSVLLSGTKITRFCQSRFSILHAVEFTLVSHSRIAQQDHDVAEKFKSSPSPRARLRSLEQLPFLLHLGLRQLIDVSPFYLIAIPWGRAGPVEKAVLKSRLNLGSRTRSSLVTFAT